MRAARGRKAISSTTSSPTPAARLQRNVPATPTAITTAARRTPASDSGTTARRRTHPLSRKIRSASAPASETAAWPRSANGHERRDDRQRGSEREPCGHAQPSGRGTSEANHDRHDLAEPPATATRRRLRGRRDRSAPSPRLPRAPQAQARSRARRPARSGTITGRHAG